MSDKADNILNKMKGRDRMELKRWTKLQRDPKRQERVLDQFNQSTLDAAGPIGGNKQD